MENKPLSVFQKIMEHKYQPGTEPYKDCACGRKQEGKLGAGVCLKILMTGSTDKYIFEDKCSLCINDEREKQYKDVIKSHSPKPIEYPTVDAPYQYKD